MSADPADALRLALDDATMFRTCEQCGLCSSACPLTGEGGFNIRRILRHLELGLVEEIAETPYAWQCTMCGRCETVCPNGIAILDLLRGLRKMAPEDVKPKGPPPCTAACPAGIDIPGYLRLIAQGEPGKAQALVFESAPFVGILGRVCTHPCETACRRGEVNEPVRICALKRYAADHGGELPEAVRAVGDDTGNRVAVIGAGPAGLTAAFYLRKKGHAVTVFEAREKPGGMMRYGIPRYRLPEDVLDKEIGQILDMGIELQANVALGRDIDIAGLEAQGFEAIFVGAGLQKSRRIEVEGADLDGVHWGLDLLGAVARGEDAGAFDRVLVVGGGDVAVDVSLTLARLGAGEITMVCLEKPEEMPAHPWEVEQAVEEGVRLLTSWGPVRIVGEDGKVTAVELKRCDAVFAADGRFAPTFTEECDRVAIDQIVLAVGQTADLSFADASSKLEVTGELLDVDPETGATSRPGVFAGGEVATGPGALVEAIGEGKKIAAAIDRSLGGDGVIEASAAERADTAGYDGKRPKGFADRPTVDLPALPVEERRGGFLEVGLCLEAALAAAEAGRCLHCDLERDACSGEPPD